MRFEFATATRIVFGQGTIKELAPSAKLLGKRALIVIGESGQRVAGLIAQLKEAGLIVSEFHVSREPAVATIEAGLAQARYEQCDVVIGIGGGSVIDAGKAVAGLMTNPGRIYDYLEVVGLGKPLTTASAPYIAIPTTAGTGSEVTRNAVLTVVDRRVKVSLRSPLILPRLAIVDPELTYSLPAEITAVTGLDALTQLVEPFLSNASNPITDAICREGICRVSQALQQAYQNGNNLQARQDMALASLLGGMALANAKLGAVHGLAGPIGGMFPAPHGALCARLLPIVLEMNLKALRERAAHASELEHFTEMSRLLTGDPDSRAEDGIQWVHKLSASLKIPALATYGITESDFPEIIAQALKASSMKGNPVELTDRELRQIMELAL